MPFVQRNEEGRIIGRFENAQPGFAEEWLDSGNEELANQGISQAQINADARAFLAKTDWYVVRHAETGEPVPDEIIKQRADARTRVVQ